MSYGHQDLGQTQISAFCIMEGYGSLKYGHIILYILTINFKGNIHKEMLIKE